MINRTLTSFMRVQTCILCHLNNEFKDRKIKVCGVLVWISESYCFLGLLISSRHVDLLIYKIKGRQTLWEKMHSHKNYV